MNDIVCGYKQVPVTVFVTSRNITTTVGMTYVKEDGRIMVFDSWVNPMVMEGLDAVDQTRIIAEAFRQFAKAITGVKHG